MATNNRKTQRLSPVELATVLNSLEGVTFELGGSTAHLIITIREMKVELRVDTGAKDEMREESTSEPQEPP